MLDCVGSLLHVGLSKVPMKSGVRTYWRGTMVLGRVVGVWASSFRCFMMKDHFGVTILSRLQSKALAGLPSRPSLPPPTWDEPLNLCDAWLEI